MSGAGWVFSAFGTSHSALLSIATMPGGVQSAEGPSRLGAGDAIDRNLYNCVFPFTCGEWISNSHRTLFTINRWLLAPPNFGKAFAIVVMLSAFLITSSHGNINLVGPIFVDHNDRVALRQDTSYIIEAIEQLRPGAVIVAGWRMSQIEVALDKEVWGKHEFYYLLENVEEFNRYTTAGHQVYFLPGVDIQNQRVNGIALEQLGAKPIYSNR
ncbi:MAG: hypothetical protein R2932_55835 [Caldilineaceae bacterium]